MSSNGAPRSVPATAKLPLAKRMSTSAASSASAAMGVPLAMILGGAPDRGAAHIGRPRAAVPAADRDPVGVALHQPDALVGDAEAVGQDLRKGRFVALPDRLSAGDQGDSA